MALGQTPHIRLQIDKTGQLYVVDQVSKEKLLIQMRSNPDGTKTSRDTAAEIESSIWDFRWDHQKPVKAAEPVSGKSPSRSRKAAPRPPKAKKKTPLKVSRKAPKKSSARKPKIDLTAPQDTSPVTPQEAGHSD